MQLLAKLKNSVDGVQSHLKFFADSCPINYANPGLRVDRSMNFSSI